MVKKGKNLKVQARWQPLPDNATTMQATYLPDVDDHSFHPEDMTLEELHNFIKLIDQSNKTLEVENFVIEKYLRKMDPNSLAKMNEILEAAALALQKAERTTFLSGGGSTLSIKDALGSRITDDSASSSSRAGTARTLSRPPSKMGVFGLSDKMVKLPVTQKIEIVNRELDELRNILENFRQKARKHNYILRCRTEEMSERLQEITEAQTNFETKLLIEGVDPITGKLPGEKFIRYLETRLKAEEIEIDKMRMKTAQLKSQLKRIKQQVAQKEELGEVLHAVDFEQLQIENRECQERLDERMAHVIDIKKINGNFVNLLNMHKKKLQEQMTKLTELQENAIVKEKLIKQLTEDQLKVNVEVETVTKAVNKITRLMENYRGPEVIEYIQKKAELNELHKGIKICERQSKLKDLALSIKLSKMKNLHEDVSRTLSYASQNVKGSQMFF